MTCNWWLSIQARYPNALQDCIDHFQLEYRERWRKEIRQPERLRQYFAQVGIDIQTQKGYTHLGMGQSGHRYGSTVKGTRLSFQREFLFADQERALKDALYFAFMVREEELAARWVRPIVWKDVEE